MPAPDEVMPVEVHRRLLLNLSEGLFPSSRAPDMSHAASSTRRHASRLEAVKLLPSLTPGGRPQGVVPSAPSRSLSPVSAGRSVHAFPDDITAFSLPSPTLFIAQASRSSLEDAPAEKRQTLPPINHPSPSPSPLRGESPVALSLYKSQRLVVRALIEHKLQLARSDAAQKAALDDWCRDLQGDRVSHVRAAVAHHKDRVQQQLRASSPSARRDHRDEKARVSSERHEAALQRKLSQDLAFQDAIVSAIERHEREREAARTRAQAVAWAPYIVAGCMMVQFLRRAINFSHLREDQMVRRAPNASEVREALERHRSQVMSFLRTTGSQRLRAVFVALAKLVVWLNRARRNLLMRKILHVLRLRASMPRTYAAIFLFRTRVRHTQAMVRTYLRVRHARLILYGKQAVRVAVDLVIQARLAASGATTRAARSRAGVSCPLSSMFVQSVAEVLCRYVSVENVRRARDNSDRGREYRIQRQTVKSSLLSQANVKGDSFDTINAKINELCPRPKHLPYLRLVPSVHVAALVKGMIAAGLGESAAALPSMTDEDRPIANRLLMYMTTKSRKN